MYSKKPITFEYSIILNVTKVLKVIKTNSKDILAAPNNKILILILINMRYDI